MAQAAASHPGTAPVVALDPEAVAAEFPILSRQFDGQPLTYLDSAATAQTPEPVIEAMDRFYRLHNANVHRSVYGLAAEATEAYERARTRVAAFIGAAREEVVFTKNVTEAINLVAYSWARSNLGPGDRVVITEMEHHSNLVPWQRVVAERGAELVYLPVGDDYRLDLEQLDDALDGAKLVALTHISNVLGTLNPIADVVERAHAAGALVLVDGAQAAPHLRLDMRALDADFYGFTGHKVYGPTGIGVLYGRRSLLESMPPFLTGGSMIARVDLHETTWAPPPTRFEAGTPPYVEAVGLAAAIDWLDGLGLDAVAAHEAELTAYAIARLSEVPGLRLLGPDGEPRGTAISFVLDGVHPHDVAELLARRGVCIRAGHHCAQPLMRRLGVPATSRASIGAHNSTADVDRLVEALGHVRHVFGLT